ncbi:MAG: excinuclease ABC subunit UvrC [Spirochaetales bacterium]|nr:excinuclease ABC subunit UvrC [Spirochaetales bacterium]
MHEDLKELIRHFPDQPGVYMMKDADDRIIYIGKATSLKKRVGSYFTGTKDVKTRLLVKNISTVEPITTRNSYEALILENNLIKKWQPRYNISLKDGKSYPVIRITSEDFPRVFRTRRIIQDGSDYFGPYPSVHRLDTYIELIEKIFPLRKCRGPLKKREHPCLYYHIGRCAAPCAGLIDKESYQETVENIRKLLTGQTDKLVKMLKEKMKAEVLELRFEQAAEFRDAIAAVSDVGKNQEVQDFDQDVRDYIAAIERDQMCTFIVFQMRKGKLLGRDLFRTENFGDLEDALHQFIFQYYADKENLPDKLYVSDLPDTVLIEEYLYRERGKRIDVRVPQRGRHVSILRMAAENGLVDMDQRLRKRRSTDALEELKIVLSLEKIPRRIEGFDISQLSGKHPVASMVSFFDGIPDKANYRKFHMKTLQGEIDDYEAMREVIARRYTRVVNEELEYPDLILVDGGKGQVNAAKGVLDALGLDNVPVAGLAKREEEIFLPSQNEPCRLPETSPALKVLQRVRDESHRFATSFNRRLRQKDVKLTRLSEIPGIGEVRSKRLIQTFGSLDNITAAKPEELSKVLKMSLEKAIEVKTALELAGETSPTL